MGFELETKNNETMQKLLSIYFLTLYLLCTPLNKRILEYPVLYFSRCSNPTGKFSNLLLAFYIKKKIKSTCNLHDTCRYILSNSKLIKFKILFQLNLISLKL